MTTVMTRPTPPPRPGRGRNAGRAAVHGLGELMITAGLVMLLLVVYQLYWTNLEAENKADDIRSELRQDWAVVQTVKNKPLPGDALAILYIQRLGTNWAKPLVEGVDLDNLARGVGHFPKSALPGQVGNFAIAAHRATHGEPFAYLDKIEPGDKVIVETRDKYFVYTIDEMKGQNRAWKLVDPDNGSVVLPVPEQPGATPKDKLITLVTCHPRWGSSSRLIVYGELTKEIKKVPGVKPAELSFSKKA
ncbi:MAG: class E sortase [Sporichthyaceae bacterium]|jgi:sortase A